ncbi:hypothetical protein H4582DRAFT_2031768 [Lactarius indigo]|nr:hypothetical protein H4582DRAFT_2031768 [Lactarius indigo]
MAYLAYLQCDGGEIKGYDCTADQSSVSTQYSPSVINAIVYQISVSTILQHVSRSKYDSTTTHLQFWGRELGGLDPEVAVTFTFEQFLSEMFSHSSDFAYPPDRSRAFFPSTLIVSFSNPSLDGTVAKAVRNYFDAVTTAGVADGQVVTVSHASAPQLRIF